MSANQSIREAREFCWQFATAVADSSSRNAVSFSSARTTKRFPSSRCASAIQIVRPLESIAETQPSRACTTMRYGFTARMKALRNLPSIWGASAPTSIPLDVRNSRASSVR
jgi:hypothetical protein